jgi:D-alanyl-D-alanine carboxypeptidase
MRHPRLDPRVHLFSQERFSEEDGLHRNSGLRDLAIGKLISPAMKRTRDRFLPAPALGETALYGLAIENQNGWIGHHGNMLSYIAYPYYLPAERITMVVLLNSGVDVPGSWAIMQDITRIISPNNLWPGLPKQ